MKLQELIFDIEADIRLGVLSFSAIAKKHQADLDLVNYVWDFMCETELAEENS